MNNHFYRLTSFIAFIAFTFSQCNCSNQPTSTPSIPMNETMNQPFYNETDMEIQTQEILKAILLSNETDIEILTQEIVKALVNNETDIETQTEVILKALEEIVKELEQEEKEFLEQEEKELSVQGKNENNDEEDCSEEEEEEKEKMLNDTLNAVIPPLVGKVSNETMEELKAEVREFYYEEKTLEKAFEEEKKAFEEEVKEEVKEEKAFEEEIKAFEEEVKEEEEVKDEATPEENCDKDHMVVIEGDATYCLLDIEKDKICGPNGGKICPKAGATALNNCNSNSTTFNELLQTCVLAEDAICEKVKETYSCVLEKEDQLDNSANGTGFSLILLSILLSALIVNF